MESAPRIIRANIAPKIETPTKDPSAPERVSWPANWPAHFSDASIAAEIEALRAASRVLISKFRITLEGEEQNALYRVPMVAGSALISYQIWVPMSALPPGSWSASLCALEGESLVVALHNKSGSRAPFEVRIVAREKISAD